MARPFTEFTIADKYRVVALLGKGGFGTVYRAVDTTLDREVALKVLHPQLAVDADFVARFRNEAKAIAALRHPNIVVVHELGDDAGRIYIAMEYLPGGSLRERLTAHGPYAFAEALRIVQEVAAGLEAAHAKGMVHRDVKPANVLFDTDGRAVVSDFGLVRAAQFSTGVASTSPGGFGTPFYKAPELWRGRPPASPATDVYALGCIVYELLTGKILFGGETPDEVITRHLVIGPEFGPDWPPQSAPPGLVDVVAQAIAREPQQRFQTAGPLAAALTELEARVLRARQEAEAEAARQAEEERVRQALAAARAEAEARVKAEGDRLLAEETRRQQHEALARAEAERRAEDERQQREAEAQARREAEIRAQEESAARTRAEATAAERALRGAQAQAEAERKVQAERKQREEAEERLRIAEGEHQRQQAQALLQREAEARAAAGAAALARQEADARAEAERRAEEERQRREATEARLRRIERERGQGTAQVPPAQRHFPRFVVWAICVIVGLAAIGGIWEALRWSNAGSTPTATATVSRASETAVTPMRAGTPLPLPTTPTPVPHTATPTPTSSPTPTRTPTSTAIPTRTRSVTSLPLPTTPAPVPHTATPTPPPQPTDTNTAEPPPKPTKTPTPKPPPPDTDTPKPPPDTQVPTDTPLP